MEDVRGKMAKTMEKINIVYGLGVIYIRYTSKIQTREMKIK